MRAEKRQKSRFLLLLPLPLMLEVLGRGVKRAVKGYNNMDHMNKNF